jgi:hypothetical protein
MRLAELHASVVCVSLQTGQVFYCVLNYPLATFLFFGFCYCKLIKIELLHF